MIKPKIDAKQALKDIRAGFDDAALMKKYNLSSKGLQSLYGKLMAAGVLHTEVIQDAGVPDQTRSEIGAGAGMREVSAKEAIVDIKSGLSDETLMGKYKVSATGLQNMFEQLLDAGLITEDDLEKGKPTVESTVDISPTVEAEVQAPPLGAEDTGAKGDTEFPATVLIDQPDIDTRVTTFEKTIKLVWECPSCAVRQSQQFDVCPNCGVKVEEFLAQKTAAEGEGPEPDAETADIRAIDKQREAELRREVEELRQLDLEREPEEPEEPEPPEEAAKPEAPAVEEAAEELTVPKPQDFEAPPEPPVEPVLAPEPPAAEREEEEEPEIVEEIEEVEEYEEEVVDLPEEITVPIAQRERVVERSFFPLEINPVVDLRALKAEIEGTSEDLHRELYPGPTRVAGVLGWIAHIQLVLVIIQAGVSILFMARTGWVPETLISYVFFPVLISVVAFVLLRAGAAVLQVAVDVALMQAKRTVLLGRLLEGLSRNRDSD